ncbi:hypothetical protein KALB_7966 [Kutzneria albida DSM 43870]|uniref:Uncharacterized protein n=2 Tax=Kutzneria TaxID=43356 RepID=W5WJE5_9PSEU|nr:hypothetical protein KALB_7966 [Kutzneria albida DSM 43870]
MVLVGIGTLFALAVALGPYLVLYLMTHPDLPTPGGH